MNIHGLNTQISPARALGARLDVTSNTPASPEETTPVHTPTPQVGTIGGVLNAEENMAIAAMFQAGRTNTYTGGGTPRTPAVNPGVYLDVQA